MKRLSELDIHTLRFLADHYRTKAGEPPISPVDPADCSLVSFNAGLRSVAVDFENAIKEKERQLKGR